MIKKNVLNFFVIPNCKFRFVLIFIAFTFSIQSWAQPVLTDLSSNEILKGIKPSLKNINLRKQAASDTLYLPFIDDFSEVGVYPDNTKWLDSAVYINSDYPISAPTVGVATFEGIDRQGNPYNKFSPSAYGKADSLTSRFINLKQYRYKNHLGIDSLVPIALSDSIFLSFYYEPKGLGNSPEFEDSLIVQFKIPSDTIWTSIRAFSGDTNTTSFKQVIIPVETKWFNRGFQFRFVNYATLSGNLDHWHIDYVRLDRASRTNMAFINDLAFVKKTSSMLNKYQAMPWSHFSATDRVSTLSLTTHNLDNPGNSAKSFNYQYGIYKPNVDTVPRIARNTTPNTTETFSNSFPFNFQPSGDTKNLQFEIRSTINTPDLNTSNDTIRYIQRFENFFAYDDGTAENGYGINLLNAKLAYEFTLSHPDTLRGIQIFFNQMLNNVSESTFKLKVWTDLTKEAIYTSPQSIKPSYENIINGFHTYKLDDQLVLVSGKFYIGFEQYTNNLLNIGYDRNTDASSHLFYNVSGNWVPVTDKGSLMMRPVVGGVIPVGINEALSKNDFRIYPNPAKDFIKIESLNELRDLRVELYDICGRLVKSEIYSGGINTSDLNPGFYILHLSDSSDRKGFNQKIIISR